MQQVHCALFEASRQSPLAAMLVVEGVVVGFTALVAMCRTHMAKYGSESQLFSTMLKKAYFLSTPL